jgi:hypothetical protein
MFKRLIDSIRKSPSKVALAVTMLALVLNVVILASWLQRARAVHTLAAQVRIIQENLTHMGQIEEGEVEELRAQLVAAEGRLALLQRGLAGAEVPFDPFIEIFDIAEQSGLMILSVQREDVTIKDTGSLSASTFSLQVEGEFSDCLKFVQNLETTAPKSVSLDKMVVTPEANSCLFEVIVLSGVMVEGP